MFHVKREKGRSDDLPFPLDVGVNEKDMVNKDYAEVFLARI